MPLSATFSGDVTVAGSLRVSGAMSIPNNAIGDEQVSILSPISADKLEHRNVVNFSQVHGSAATAERRVVYCAHGAGTLDFAQAGVTVAAVGDSTVSVDVKKNGTTVLSGAIVLDNSNVAFTPEDGTISSAAYVAEDVFEVVVTVSAGTGTLPQGLFVQLVFTEEA